MCCPYQSVFCRGKSKNEHLNFGNFQYFLTISNHFLSTYLKKVCDFFRSALGGVTFLGIPTEIYLHGTVNAANMFSMVGIILTIIYLTLPVFWNLELDNIYEYLELRFSKSAKTMASNLYIFSLFLYTPIMIYAPALAFSQVTGFEINSVSITFSVICILYTSFVSC